MKFCPVVPYIVTKNVPMVTKDIPPTDIELQLSECSWVYCYWGGLQNCYRWDPFVLLPLYSSNIYVCPIVINIILLRQFNDYNGLYQNNKMHQYFPALHKYWVAKSGYFRNRGYSSIIYGYNICKSSILLGHFRSNYKQENQ